MAVDLLRRVVIVDDDDATLGALRQLIELEPDLVVAGTATGAEEALDVIARVQPDVVVVDLVLGDGPDGIQVAKLSRAIAPAVPVLVLSAHDEALFAERALAAGASGFVMKDEGFDELCVAIRHVLRGRIRLSERVWRQLGREARHLPDVSLDDLDRRVLSGLRAGLSNPRLVADRLRTDERTVSDVLDRLLQRTGLGSWVNLALYAEAHDVHALA